MWNQKGVIDDRTLINVAQSAPSRNTSESKT